MQKSQNIKGKMFITQKKRSNHNLNVKNIKLEQYQMVILHFHQLKKN